MTQKKSKLQVDMINMLRTAILSNKIATISLEQADQLNEWLTTLENDNNVDTIRIENLERINRELISDLSLSEFKNSSTIVSKILMFLAGALIGISFMYFKLTHKI